MNNGVQWDEDDNFNDTPILEAAGKDPITGDTVWIESNSSETIQVQTPPRLATRLAAKMETSQELSPQEILEQSEEAEAEEYANTLSDAQLRIEQGRLYQLVMNNDIFQNMDIDPRAIKAVQREIRRFAKDRMEVMLGMKQDIVTQTQNNNLNFPFNNLEVSILKTIAAKATNGATEREDANKLADWKEKKTSLTPINSTKSMQTTPLSAKKPVVQKTKISALEKKAKLDDVFEPDYKPLDKPPSLMTHEECIQRNKEAMARQENKKSVKSATALPMPTVEQEEMLYANRAANAKTMGTGLSVTAILRAMEVTKK